MTKQKPRFSKPMAFFWLLRLNRTVMVALITGAAAFVASAGVATSLWMTLAGWCLAVRHAPQPQAGLYFDNCFHDGYGFNYMLGYGTGQYLGGRG